MSALEPHYSDLTLQALIEHHGWERGYSLGPSDELSSVSRTFVGVGRLGGMAVPDGARRLYAGYAADAERRRYIALTLGDARILDLDGRDASPADIARLINLKAEQFADEKRVANGLSPLYAVGSPAVAMQFGRPDKTREAASLAAQHDAARSGGRVLEAQCHPVAAPVDDDETGGPTP